MSELRQKFKMQNKGNVATAQQALDAAQATATAENPNDAAINQAERQLAKAQQEEQAAQQNLMLLPLSFRKQILRFLKVVRKERYQEEQQV